jgi:hypothetical protein
MLTRLSSTVDLRVGLYLACLCLLVVALASERVVARDLPLAVSVGELIANPKKFDGKELVLGGIASAEYEDTALYGSSDSFLHVWSPDSLDVVLSPDQYKKYRELHGKYVTITGVYRHREVTGGLASRGSITNVSFIRIRESRGQLSNLGERR